jgi:hypothetical protein
MTEEYTLTVPEAAAMLGETEKAVQRLIYTAKLDAIRIKGARGHEFRVRPADITTRKAELQQRIAEAQADPALPPAQSEQPAVRSDSPGEACPAPVREPAVQPEHAHASPVPAAAPALLAPSAEAIPVGVYQELFRRYDQLGRRAAKLECENRHLRDALQRMQAPEDVPTSAPSCAGDAASPRTDLIRCQEGGSMPAGPPAPTSRQLWRSFADRVMLLGGIRSPRP